VPTAEDLHELDDRALMTAVRQGRKESFGHLYHRHAAAAAAYARRLVGHGADEHDIVADAFLRVFGILARGMGPQDSFRPYLLRAVRNAAYDRSRAERRLELTDELSVLEGVVPFRDTVEEQFDRELVVRAFRDLPGRWQKVLWLTVIEELPVDVAAAQLGINTNSLTSLAYRAREGLRQAYLRTSLASGKSPVCPRLANALIRFVRGTVAPTDRRMVEEHLDSCDGCRTRIRELRETDALLWDRSAARIPAQKTASTTRRGRRPSGRAEVVGLPAAEPDDYSLPA
jgi:RNA polymerase sigma factor (sigma-70 family)